MNKPISNIRNIVNFRYAPKKYINWEYPKNVNLKILKIYPNIFYNFNTVIWNFENKPNIKIFNINNNCILCKSTNKCIKYLLSNINSFSSIDIIVFAGEDEKLSSNLAVINKLLKYCNKIYFEAKDVAHNEIKTIPMGLNIAYVLRNGGKRILNVINKTDISKQKLITCAYGNKWPILNKTINERKKLINFCNKHKWISKSEWEPVNYYKNLAKYKFFICPLGNGIQAPKIFECLLVKTVPVVLNHPAFLDIKNYGFPILIIENFNQLNPEFLNDKYNSVYKNIDWDNIKYMLTTKGFIENILKITYDI